MSVTDWSACNCDWRDVEILVIPCACGNPECAIDFSFVLGNDRIHWQGGHWHFVCAFKAALKLFADKERLEDNNDKREGSNSLYSL